MKTHSLKTVPYYFEALWDGSKTFEVRNNDRDFKVGDFLTLKEWDNIQNEYLGREVFAQITYVLDGFNAAIKDGYVVLGIKVKSLHMGASSQ